MQTQIIGLKIKGTLKQKITSRTEDIIIPAGVRRGESVRGELWLKLEGEDELRKVRRFVDDSRHLKYTDATRYHRVNYPCFVCAYCEDTGQVKRFGQPFMPGIIFTAMATFAPGCILLRWIRERPVDLSNPEDVERMFAAVNRRRTQEGKPSEYSTS